MCPEPLDRYSYIVFECTYPVALPLPFSMEGDCPVIVTAMNQADNTIYGVLTESHGEQAPQLLALGLFPTMGDVIVAVDKSTVTQLNSSQLARLLTRQRRLCTERAEDQQNIRFTFRRHFLKVCFYLSLYLHYKNV